MFCPECGTQVSDNAVFCRKCGISLGEDDGAASQPVAPVESQPVAQQGVPGVGQAVPSPVMTQPRPAPQTMRHTLGATKPVQPIVGIAVMIGAALAVIGTMLAWIDFGGATANGFDGGYLTGGSPAMDSQRRLWRSTTL